MKPLPLLFLLLFCNCSEVVNHINTLSGHPPYREEHVAGKQHIGVMCDSLSNLSDDDFQHMAFHPLRSSKSIENSRSLIIDYFKAYLNSHHEIFIKASKCTLSLEVPPNGKVISRLKWDTLSHDSLIFLKAKQLLTAIRFDSIPCYTFSLRLVATATKKVDSIEIDSNLTPIYMQAYNGRSRESIMEVVMANIAELRYAYNKRLRETPGIRGTITIKFAIDEYGEIIFCAVTKTTMYDLPLETVVADKIRNWRFCKIHRPGDVTEVVYPFTFSQ